VPLRRERPAILQRYPRGIKISKAELAAINIERHSFHGEWNYTIKPNKKPH